MATEGAATLWENTGTAQKKNAKIAKNKTGMNEI
jgi:hypothetical protein